MNVHILSLMFRKKDNPNYRKDKYVFQEVYNVGDFDTRIEKINKLREIANISTGTWRIYESVNDRDTEKASKMLIHQMIDGLVNIEKIDSEWKSLLQKPECRGSRNFLLDLDYCSNQEYLNVMKYLHDNKVEILEYYGTVNGYHIITDKFDCREVKELFKFVDVKTDDMKLVISFEVK